MRCAWAWARRVQPQRVRLVCRGSKWAGLGRGGVGLGCGRQVRCALCVVRVRSYEDDDGSEEGEVSVADDIG
jgi:hypothetical protein